MAICRHRLKLPGSNEIFTSEVNQKHVLVIVHSYNCLHSRHFTDVTSAKDNYIKRQILHVINVEKSAKIDRKVTCEWFYTTFVLGVLEYLPPIFHCLLMIFTSDDIDCFLLCFFASLCRIFFFCLEAVLRIVRSILLEALPESCKLVDE